MKAAECMVMERALAMPIRTLSTAIRISLWLSQSLQLVPTRVSARGCHMRSKPEARDGRQNEEL